MNKKSNIIADEITEDGINKKHFQENIKANESLKDILKLALKQTSTTTKQVLPKLANAVVNYINEFKQHLDGKTKTDEMMALLSRSELSKHCYDLVGYNRKDETNDLFEKVVSRAVRLAIMIVDYPTEFAVDEKTNEVFVMSKTLEPKVEKKVKGSKVVSKENNNDESLLPVSTYVVDKMYKIKYPTKSRNGKTQDEKTLNNFKNITVDMVKSFKKIIKMSKRKDVKFFDVVDDTTFESLEELKNLLNSEDYQTIRQFSVEYQVDYNGNLELREAANQ